MEKSYINCCGSCIDCNLPDRVRLLFAAEFKCIRSNIWVKADDNACDKYTYDVFRTDELIAKYDR